MILRTEDVKNNFPKTNHDSKIAAIRTENIDKNVASFFHCNGGDLALIDYY
jgi:hypothetical protein